MHPSQRSDSEAFDIPSTSLAVVDACDVDVDAEGDWYLSDVPSCDEIDIRSSLTADFSVTYDNCIEHSVEALTMAAGVFKLALRALNAIGERQELSASVDRRRRAIRSSEAQVQPLQREI